MADDELVAAVIRLGRGAAVAITGDPDDAAEVRTVEQALAAIKESLRLGYESHQQLQKLLYPSKKEFTPNQE